MDFVASGFGDFTESRLGDRNSDFNGTFSIRFWYQPTTHDQYGINQSLATGWGSQTDIFYYANNSGPSGNFDHWGLGRVGAIGGGDPSRLFLRRFKASIQNQSMVISQSFFVGNGTPPTPWRHVAAGIVKTESTGATHLWIQIDNMGRLFIATSPLGPMPFSIPSVPGWHLRMRSPGYNPSTTSPSGAFRSWIDEVAVWRGHYLTEDEVAASYNAGAGVGFAGTPRPDKLIAYWDMEGFSTTSPTKTLTDQLNNYNLVADASPGGVPGGYPTGTGEITAGKINNGLELWGAWDNTPDFGFIAAPPSDWYLQADPANRFDFGVEP